jgi:hypothetical protein
MWDSQHLTNSKACDGDRFIIIIVIVIFTLGPLSMHVYREIMELNYMYGLYFALSSHVLGSIRPTRTVCYLFSMSLFLLSAFPRFFSLRPRHASASGNYFQQILPLRFEYTAVMPGRVMGNFTEGVCVDCLSLRVPRVE